MEKLNELIDKIENALDYLGVRRNTRKLAYVVLGVGCIAVIAIIGSILP